MRGAWLVILVALSLTACGAAGPSVDEQIQAAVQQTVAAMPTAGASVPAPMPEPTNQSLKGLFCEYEFCIGHPAGMAFFDVIAKQNPTTPTESAYDDGILAANNSSLFLEVIWQTAPSGTDGQFMLDRVIDGNVDSKTGDVQPLLVRELNVFFVPIGTKASAALPYGGAAAWTCGARAFGWKSYTMQPDLAKNLLMDALVEFRCEG